MAEIETKDGGAVTVKEDATKAEENKIEKKIDRARREEEKLLEEEGENGLTPAQRRAAASAANDLRAGHDYIPENVIRIMSPPERRAVAKQRGYLKDDPRRAVSAEELIKFQADDKRFKKPSKD